VSIGIFGGTFDPPHIGHLIAAQDACETLQLQRLIFVPAAQPPHKRDRQVTPAEIRLDLLKAAIAGDVRFQVCELELQRAGPSYTVDTLRQLSGIFPGEEFYLLLGADQVRDLPTWHEPAEVARLAHVVLISRSGVDALPDRDGLAKSAIQVTRIDVSATDIRQRVAAGRSIRYLVPRAVEAIIRERGLYRSNEPLLTPNGDALPGVAS
jgi:nicotinate-nucleotide adenylyltransferase